MLLSSQPFRQLWYEAVLDLAFPFYVQCEVKRGNLLHGHQGATSVTCLSHLYERHRAVCRLVLWGFQHSHCWVKQGCVLASLLFGISFAVILKHALNHQSTNSSLTLHRIGWKAVQSGSPEGKNLSTLLFTDGAALTHSTKTNMIIDHDFEQRSPSTSTSWG